MKKIAIVSKKGGVGKTTLAMHLAAQAVKDGTLTALLDMDPQGCALYWAEKRAGQREFVAAPTNVKELKTALQNLEKLGAELVLIDTPPHTSSIAINAVNAVDFVLVPSCLDDFSLHVLEQTFSEVIAVAEQRPTQIIINSAPPVGNEAQRIKERLRDKGLPVCETVISRRVAFSRHIKTGNGANECEPDSKAAEEIKSLWQTIKEQIA